MSSHQYYEMPEYPQSLAPANHQSLPTSHPPPVHTPYLGLRARLSQVWLNRWTVLLLLIVVRLLLATRDVHNNLISAQDEALAACRAVEHVGSAMASMPHYLSAGVNALSADAMTEAVQALATMLMLALTGVEEMVLFIINLLTSTYVCLITLAVTGSLQAQLAVIEDIADLVETSVNDITGTMSDSLSGFTNDLNRFIAKINIGGILGGVDGPPTVNLNSQIDALRNIRIDTTKLDAKLDRLNSSIPTFAEVQNFTNGIIAIPFERVRQLVNGSLANYTFDETIFPRAQKQQLTFCSDNDGIRDFFSTVQATVSKARTIFLAVLLVAAILVCIPMAYREIWRWRNMQSRAVLLERNSFDPMDVIYIASRPITTTWGIKLSSRIGGTTKRQILTRWLVAYATSLPVLFVLALGLAGLLSCLCQYILLAAIKTEVPELISKVANFADKVVSALDGASATWARDANAVVLDTNKRINDDVFGWVTTSTVAVNNTLNAFSDTMTTALNDTFGGTVLYKPITGVFNCLVELKVQGIQKGLTWVHDHAHVNIPSFRPDVFSLGAAASVASNDTDAAGSFLAAPGESTSDEISNAVLKVVGKFETMIRQEAIISVCLVCVWLLVFLIGLGRVLYALTKSDKVRIEGGHNHGAHTHGGLYPAQSLSLPAFARLRGPLGMTVDENRHVNVNNHAKIPELSPRYEENDGWGDVGLGAGEGILGSVDPGEKTRLGTMGVTTVQAVQVDAGHERKSSHGYVGYKA